MQSLSASQLKTLTDEDAATILIDVREPWEYELCSIPGSRHLPMAAIPSHVNDFDKDKPIVVICHHGMRSLQVAQYLVRSGFTKVFNLEGGIDAWSRDVDPNVPRY
jgi:rhodanese-related sulfurtransferase